MKKILLPLLIVIISQTAKSQDHIQDSTIGFSFEINYWFNLHHFLWLESFLNVHKDSTVIHQTIPTDFQEGINKGLEYYKMNLVKYNLRSSDYMSEFKNWVTSSSFDLEFVPEKFQEHVNTLKEVSESYKKFLWPVHKAACVEVLEDNIELIRKTEKEFAYGITELARQPWQRDKIKVDITYFGTASTWNYKHRPYTTLFPTHVVMTAVGENDIDGNWVELLYHEAAHHLILSSKYFIGGTIEDVCEVMNIEPPRQFWHSYLFYMTGELVKKIFLENNLDYKTTYMVREGVYGRYYSLLDTHLKSYMERKITLEEATRNILTDLNE